MKITDKYVLFWNGPFSNWTPSAFVINDVEYNCVEQYMMFRKAELFGDVDSMKRIMETTMPNEQKAIGRKVKGYDDAVWSAERFPIVVDACRAKFNAHPDLKQILLDTGNKIIVEASPYDVVWGIGLGENDPDALDESKWRGDNLLGKALMEVRTELTNI